MAISGGLQLRRLAEQGQLETLGLWLSTRQKKAWTPSLAAWLADALVPVPLGRAFLLPDKTGHNFRLAELTLDGARCSITMGGSAVRHSTCHSTPTCFMGGSAVSHSTCPTTNDPTQLCSMATFSTGSTTDCATIRSKVCAQDDNTFRSIRD